MLAWVWALAGLLVAIALLYVGGGWYFGIVLRADALDGEQRRAELLSPELDLTVAAMGGDTVTIRLPDDPGALLTEGVWGIQWSDGYGQASAIVSHGDGSVVREFRHLSGTELTAGSPIRFDERAYRGDPQIAFDLEFSEVAYEGELGAYSAWFVDGDRDTWVILVHGIGMTRENGLPLLPTLRREGYPTHMISFRNDPGAPEDPSGMLRYGATEWKDLEAAARYALDEGAADLILVGYSMGGGIVVNFLYESPLAEAVRAVVLDAPMLNFGRTVDHRAGQENLPLLGLGVPRSLTTVAKWLAGWRFDLDWAALDYLARADELSVPILLLHGTEDTVVPIETSDELAEARPDLVTYVRIEGADHMQTWNVDPERYEAEVSSFLRAL